MKLFAENLKLTLLNAGIATHARRLRSALVPRLRAQAAAVTEDFKTFQAHYGSWLTAGVEREQPGRVALVLSFAEYPAQVKQESLLAKALQLNGLRPVMVTSRAAVSAIRYYRVFGFRDFARLDAVAPSRPTSDMVSEANRLLADRITVQDLLAYEYRGAHLGARLLRTLARVTYSCDFQLDKAEVRAYLRRLLLNGMVNVMRAERLLDRWKPEVVLCHHPLNFGEGEVFDAALARGINTVFWDDAQKAGNWLFTRVTSQTRDVQTFSVSESTWRRVRDMLWTAERDAHLMREIRGRYDPDSRHDTRRLQAGKRLTSRDEIVSRLGLDPAKKTAVIFAHIGWDTSFFHGRDLFQTYDHWLVETVRAACRNPAINWIVKLHPANLLKLRGNGVTAVPSEIVALERELGKLPPHIRLLPSDTEINTWSLLEMVDYGLTVRGTIGIELPCLGVPVLTAGTGRYSGRGFTIDSSTAEEYLDRVEHIHEIRPPTPEQVVLAKRHAYVLFVARMQSWPFVTKQMRPKSDAGHPLYSNCVLAVNSLSELESREELRRFAEWVIDSREIDMVDWSKLA